jgi:Trp operon repressor
MAVVQVATWSVEQGRMQDFLTNAATAKKIHERLGARVRVLQSFLAGEASGRVAYVIECADIAEWGSWTQKQQTDPEWQAFVAGVLSAPDPGARLVSNSLASDIPGAERDEFSWAPGNVVTTFTWRVKPGRLAELIESANQFRLLANRVGARVRSLQTQYAGPNSGNAVAVIEYDDFAAFGKASQALAADPDFQALAASRIQSPEAPADLLGSALALQLPV